MEIRVPLFYMIPRHEHDEHKSFALKLIITGCDERQGFCDGLQAAWEVSAFSVKQPRQYIRPRIPDRRVNIFDLPFPNPGDIGHEVRDVPL